MGLDGISVNQLRIMQEVNVAHDSETYNLRRIDGAAKGQKVTRDKEKEKQDNSGFEFENQEDEHGENETNDAPYEALKYDLDDCEKYILKIDENSNNVVIIKKDTDEVVQVFSAEVLMKLTGFLQNSQGALVNRKF